MGVTADDYYAQQRWKDALSAYKKNETPTVATLERMGTCAAHLSRHADAVLYWRRAQKRSSWGRYFFFERMVAGAQAAAGVSSVGHPVVRIIRNGICAIPLLLWQLLLLLLWAALLWCGRRWWAKKRLRPLITLVATILFFGCITSVAFQYATARRAVVVASAALRSGPSERYTQLATLISASEVNILKTDADAHRLPYYKVRQGDLCGWISSAEMRQI